MLIEIDGMSSFRVKPVTAVSLFLMRWPKTPHYVTNFPTTPHYITNFSTSARNMRHHQLQGSVAFIDSIVLSIHCLITRLITRT